MRATSSHLLNLRPTSRSIPTNSKPHERCRAIEASLAAEMRANTAWNPETDPTRNNSATISLPMPCPLRSRRT